MAASVVYCNELSVARTYMHTLPEHKGAPVDLIVLSGSPAMTSSTVWVLRSGMGVLHI